MFGSAVGDSGGMPESGGEEPLADEASSGGGGGADSVGETVVDDGDGGGRDSEDDGSDFLTDDGDTGGVALPLAPSAHKVNTTMTADDARREGMQKARRREMVRQAARRGVAFGFLVADDGGKGRMKRRVEAVQGGRVVESSFAKGEWGVRWREGG